MKNETLQPKEYPLLKNIGKVVLIGVAVLSVLFTANAAFTDTVLNSLESSYKSANFLHERAVQKIKDANNDERSSADNLCNAYKAIKSYKELKAIKLQDETVNPCTQVKAPQEGF